MSSITLEQAIFVRSRDGRSPSASPGFQDIWFNRADEIMTAFGTPTGDLPSFAAMFATRFDKQHVAVVQVSLSESVNAGGVPSFRFLLIQREDYLRIGGDCFGLADRFPIPPNNPRELPRLQVDEALPQPGVQDVKTQLQHAEIGPVLLGAAQALVDGAKVVFEQPEPDTRLLRNLWAMLPRSTRCDLWPASFTFGNQIGFDVAVTPRADASEYAGYVRGQQIADYPLGTYERNLHVAIDAADQGELDRLLSRRSRKETWRLAWLILLIVPILALVGNMLTPPPAPKLKKTATDQKLLPQRQKLQTDIHDKESS